MKQPFRAIIPLLFSVALLLSLTTTASAAFSDFTDVKGHWAEGTLHQAYDDGILKGYDAKTGAQPQCDHGAGGDHSVPSSPCDGAGGYFTV